MDLVLDTNIYRNLVRNLEDSQVEKLIIDIKQKCKEKDIVLLFPINSAMELLSHFNDEIPIEKEECRNALKLLVNLSTTTTATNLHVDFTPPLNVILGSYFFGEEQLYTKLYGKVITLSQMLIGNVEAETEELMNKHVQTVSDQLEFEKKEIRDNYEEYLKSINNGDADWTYFKDKKQLRRNYFERLKIGRLSFLVAQSFVDRAYNIAGKQIEKDQDYHDKVIQFMQDFCPALVMNELLLENVGHGVDAIKEIADKRWNTVIDISLIFGALFNPRNIDRKLVTEEKNIIDAFGQCGFENKVINLEQFKALVD